MSGEARQLGPWRGPARLKTIPAEFFVRALRSNCAGAKPPWCGDYTGPFALANPSRLPARIPTRTPSPIRGFTLQRGFGGERTCDF